MEGVLRITCPYCRAKSVITAHTRPADKLEELYCDCTNRGCGARFVYRAYYAHTLTPPASTLLDSLAEQIANLPDAERRKLLATYGSSPVQGALF